MGNLLTGERQSILNMEALDCFPSSGIKREKKEFEDKSGSSYFGNTDSHFDESYGMTEARGVNLYDFG